MMKSEPHADEFCAKNDGIYIHNDGFYIHNDGFYIHNDGTPQSHTRMQLNAEAVSALQGSCKRSMKFMFK